MRKVSGLTLILLLGTANTLCFAAHEGKMADEEMKRHIHLLTQQLKPSPKSPFPVEEKSSRAYPSTFAHQSPATTSTATLVAGNQGAPSALRSSSPNNSTLHERGDAEKILNTIPTSVKIASGSLNTASTAAKAAVYLAESFSSSAAPTSAERAKLQLEKPDIFTAAAAIPATQTAVDLPIASAVTLIKYEGEGITDDEIANAIQDPKPTSVTQAIDDIKKKRQKNLSEVKEFDLNGNNVTARGATQILEFAIQELPNLTTLNLSANRIYDQEKRDQYNEFENKVIELLSKKEFQCLDIRFNRIANGDWIEHLKKHPQASKYISKIKWEDDESSIDD